MHYAADSEDGQLVRQQLSGLTQQLRPYSLTGEETFEVISSGVFFIEEVNSMCHYKFKKETIQALSEFSNETKPRKLKKTKSVLHKLEADMLDEIFFQEHYCYNFTLTTKRQRHAIELLPLECLALGRNLGVPVDSTYEVSCSATITEWTNKDVHEPVINFSKYVKYGVKFEIPLAVDGRNITLKPNTKYSVKMMVKGDHRQWSSNVEDDELLEFEDEHLILCIGKQGEWYDFPSNRLMYRTSED